MKDLKRFLQSNLRAHVQEAVKRGYLDLLYLKSPQNLRLLHLLTPQGNPFLTEVVERNQITPRELSDGGPFELVVETGRTDAKDLILQLPAFIRFNYDFAEGSPIRIYERSPGPEKYALKAVMYQPKSRVA